MDDRLSKKIEVGANIAIIVVACLLGAVLIKNYFIAKQPKNPDVFESKNVTISLPDEDWSRSGQTLVLAVSSTCHFCTESASFYRRLAEAHPKARLIAVLPQSSEEGKRYLEGLGVAVDEIKQVSLGSINVSGTPTLILVNNNGVVTDRWVGKLEAAQEDEVLSKAR
jgi:hypothetical protein